MRIEVLEWPEDEAALERLRAAGLPRLLVVAPGVRPPATFDPVEDWMRRDADRVDFEVRIETLRRRAGARQHLPVIDGSGVLHHRGRWVALSPVEARIVATLVARFGTVIGRDVLARTGQLGGAATRNRLDVQMVRVRRRLEPLGLEVRTVRSRGYLVQFAREDADRVAP